MPTTASPTERIGVPGLCIKWTDKGHIAIEDTGSHLRYQLGANQLFLRGDVYSIAGNEVSTKDIVLGQKLLECLVTKSWDAIDGQFSAILVTPNSIKAFRSPFSPYLLYYDNKGVSDRLALLANRSSDFSFDYLQNFVLDYPSLQFSSELTPFKNIHRLPSCCEVTLQREGEFKKRNHPFAPYDLVEDRGQNRADLVEETRHILKEILRWHLAKGKQVHAELSGGLDSSFICALLSDLTGNKFSAHMYAYRKHPSHTYSERCAERVASEKNISLTIVDSAEIETYDLTQNPPYQDEPIDFYWQGILFGPICQRLTPKGSALYTGFGGDQLFMRSHDILNALFNRRRLSSLYSLLPTIARSSNRSVLNFFYQFGLSRFPRRSLVGILDRTRNMQLNPFRMDELLPEMAAYDRVPWLKIEARKNPAVWMWELHRQGEALETPFFLPNVPHSNLNYLVAPSFVIGPYLEAHGITYIHPYCDKRLIDFVFRKVPWSYIYDFKNLYKYFLREVQAGFLPEDVRLRSHDDFCCDGFYYTLLNSNRDFFKALLRDAARNYSGWINERALFESFQSLLFGGYSNSELKLGRLFGYLVWKHHFMERLI